MTSGWLLRGLGLATAGGIGLLAASPTARSLAIRLLAAGQPDPVRARGVRVSTAIDRGDWTRLRLAANLSGPLSAAANRPLVAVAYSHFAGFGGRPYAAWLDPRSSYYQAWLGAYVVFAEEGPAFGFDERERPTPQAALQLLEADQRLVLDAAGLLPREDQRPRVKLVSDLDVEQVISWAGNWVRVRGTGETASAFQRGGRLARRRARWLYGVVPEDFEADVQDFHLLRCHASLWYRFVPALRATVAKFYVYAEYVDALGERVALGERIAGECEALMDGIRFDWHQPTARAVGWCLSL